MLRLVADILAHACRPEDLVCRWGGEEFAVIDSNTVSGNLRVVAERSRQEVAAVRHIEEDLVLGVTVSLGATLARREDTPESLIQRCDQLLYEAEESGRDRVECDDESADVSVTEPGKSS